MSMLKPIFAMAFLTITSSTTSLELWPTANPKVMGLPASSVGFKRSTMVLRAETGVRGMESGIELESELSSESEPEFELERGESMSLVSGSRHKAESWVDIPVSLEREASGIVGCCETNMIDILSGKCG